jgi:RNA polymerase sigma-70 factor (sigma-E family)
VEVAVSDAASFEEYVRARSAGLGRVAYLLTGDAHLAEDLVQLTLIRVAGHWERISAARDPDQYVRRVLYTQHVSWWRRVRLEAVPAAELRDVPAEDFTGRLAVGLAVRAALLRLPPRQRAVIVLRYFEDLTEAQTAQALGVAVGTVKSQSRDALARLRQFAPELAELPLSEVAS